MKSACQAGMCGEHGEEVREDARNVCNMSEDGECGRWDTRPGLAAPGERRARAPPLIGRAAVSHGGGRARRLPCVSVAEACGAFSVCMCVHAPETHRGPTAAAAGRQTLAAWALLPNSPDGRTVPAHNARVPGCLCD